ncbi:GNAT family N-acetyltransferase [Aneurinibacillus migulanus]|uniref:Acetyltransferase n=2 Tax=Aneurinibacillus migulanus TaxID=47500 RepID=A0A0D1XUK9_ANEMI|nr:GNAT family N-acetyltransferase [Aneurinibacillus migulanus]KIV55818.1 acetyltransferase [Aneurinibacillus migulanus]KON98451.1 acetyltransferase [Aneurinibacillus migulanus]MED0891663.1 GNAT family N-acetyltransferase [Aneurinibacillus migulanus]MED1617597.1 GNAT family N-acetyltransferase [Aneurinibacillus migulanus]
MKHMSTYTIKRVHNEAEKNQALSVRRLVFIEEQNVPENIEVDVHDDENTATIHVLALDGQGEAVGAGRLREYEPGIGKIERVAVLSSCRSHGLGRLLMEKLEAEATENGYHTVKLNAQLQAQPFYERLGYKPEGDTFMDAGIEHIAMVKTV